MNKYKKQAKAAQLERRKFLSCETKRRYIYTDAHKNLPNDQRVYACSFCSHYHRAKKLSDGKLYRGSA
jgi:hypothetical protein